jgi:hypothetical protein
MSNAQPTHIPAQFDPRGWWALALLGGRAAPKPLRLVSSQAPGTGANGAPRARPFRGAAGR